MENLVTEPDRANSSLVRPRVPNPDFWRGRRVLLTGQTGFKGGWLALWLKDLGADVVAFALPPEVGPAFYNLARVEDKCDSRFIPLSHSQEIRDLLADRPPEIVFHLAAQAIVRRAIADPAETIASNVTGLGNLLDALRVPDIIQGLSAVLIVTSDKVYLNDNSGKPFVEADALGGHDPYSASKAAAEMVVHAYQRAYFGPAGIPLATARGGNVIGGRDFAADRIASDCVRAAIADSHVTLRHPDATRPWQHVLDCLNGYLLYAEAMAEPFKASDFPLALNFGPRPEGECSVQEFATTMMQSLGIEDGVLVEREASIEAAKLAIDATRARNILGWDDVLVGEKAIRAAARWYKGWQNGEDMQAITIAEIRRYQKRNFLESEVGLKSSIKP